MMNTAHTIISLELVKPSSPTPSHLQTYNLSELDQRSTHAYMPLILYYPNNEISILTPNDKVRVMKKSLSEVLTRYYPFAGSLHTPTSPYIDCNDEGVVFVEAKYDCQMKIVQHISEEDDTIGHLFVDGMIWQHGPYRPNLLGVQVNHFACGGMAVTVSMSHRIADGGTLGLFITLWASVARYGSTDHKEVLPLNPHFIQHPKTTNILPPEAAFLNPSRHNTITRKFVFPNSKLSDLKNKILTLAGGNSTLSINNPTRVDILTSLLYKTAMAATTSSSSSFKPSFLTIPANIRNKLVPKLPPTTVGNYVATMLLTTRDESETSLSVLVSKIKEQKTELERIRCLQMARQNNDSVLSSLGNEDLDNVVKRSFVCTSICGWPASKLNFGWGNPEVASVTYRCSNLVGSFLMDAPNGDGIQAWVTLEKPDMERFQNDKELLSFCQN
ncbi:akuammiline synthase 1-like [Bidens hawaiensis]|uniref:akuammiline synthase 1-like n=1 Tax=Bidens hawaiensis TaxID=980011 RepID=UPI0040490126